MVSIDYLLVGQGLAGSCLALELISQGKKVLVVDEPRANTASKVAAGLFNPITGKTMETTWMANQLFEKLPVFYRDAERITGGSFLFEKPIYRPFISEHEIASWQNRPHNFVRSLFTVARYPEIVHDTFGGLELRASGYLDTTAFLAAVRAWLRDNNGLIEEAFSFLNHDPEKGTYKEIEARAVIFCEGVAVLNNPHFNWLPVKKLKGEVLTVSANLPSDIIFNRGVFAVPSRDQGQFIMGSTYQNTDVPGNTPQGFDDLTRKSSALFVEKVTVRGQNWGFRPTSPDRRPMLGAHPKFPKMMVFNGLGTKGVSLAPYFSGVMAQWLSGVSELPPEVNIARYYSLSFKAE